MRRSFKRSSPKLLIAIFVNVFVVLFCLIFSYIILNKIKTDYETANTLIRYLENYSLIEKKFQTKVSLIYKINPSEKDDFLEQTINYSKGKAEVLLLKIANQ